MKKQSLIRRSVVSLWLAGALALASSAVSGIPSVTSLRMESSGGSSKFVIQKQGEISVQDFALQDPQRLVLDFIGARHELDRNVHSGDGKCVERVRTSQFTDSPQVVTRVVFDLKDNSDYEIVNTENRVVVAFAPKGQPNPFASTKNVMGASVSPAGVGSWGSTQPSQGIEGKGRSPSASPSTVSASAKPDRSGTQAPKPSLKRDGDARPEASLAGAWRKVADEDVGASGYPQERSPYSPKVDVVKNRNITIDVQNASIKAVLRSISEFSNTNIISGPEVEGDVTAHLKNVPWRQALSIVLKAHGYGFREEYGIIRVSTIENLTKEELELQAAERKKDDLLPVITKIIPLSYANADEMKEALDRMVSSGRGSIEVEKGSNALIVTDIEKKVQKIEALAAELDRKLDQVEIVAKMVDVDFEATQEFGIKWEFVNLSPANVSVVGDATVEALTASPVGRFRVGTVRAWGEVLTIIDILEKENKANIISNPRIVTADNREASILVGKEVPLIVSDEAGNPITELTKVGIGLRVTPHVNSDKSITMDLHPEVSELSAQATVQGGVIISVSEADTRVVVGNGETAVIGGLINEVESLIENGLPILRDVPILGNLFTYKSKTKKKRELIIFVTPKIISGTVAVSS